MLPNCHQVAVLSVPCVCIFLFLALPRLLFVFVYSLVPLEAQYLPFCVSRLYCAIALVIICIAKLPEIILDEERGGKNRGKTWFFSPPFSPAEASPLTNQISFYISRQRSWQHKHTNRLSDQGTGRTPARRTKHNLCPRTHSGWRAIHRAQEELIHTCWSVCHRWAAAGSISGTFFLSRYGCRVIRRDQWYGEGCCICWFQSINTWINVSDMARGSFWQSSW